MYAAFAGFTLGFSLILAIGAQNAFVLKQGIRQQYVFLVCLICALSDALLIIAGVSGFGILLAQVPSIGDIARIGGALFLLGYGLRSLYSAWNYRHAMKPAGSRVDSPWSVALVCLAFTWLNPHVYLDTVVLIGSVSTQYPDAQLPFGVGAVTSSFVFFFGLGYGARWLAPIFERPRAWQVLEFCVGLLMFALAAMLLTN